MLSMIVGQAQRTGPMGPEFGKASPIGLFILVVLVVLVLYIGYLVNRRIKRLERRKTIATMYGVDLFDAAMMEKAIKAESMDINPYEAGLGVPYYGNPPQDPFESD